MADRHLWIQLENRAWDLCPNNIDRITGEIIARDPATGPSKTGKAPVNKSLHSPGTGVTKTRKMHMPMGEDALILRRYKPPQNTDASDAWTVPDDRKVNAWDLNEPDPTDNGTMGTIPGAVIECEVGDRVIVHFRNWDQRARTVIKTVKVPIGFGTIEIPLPVAEPLPAERRAHSLHPHGFVFAPTSDGAYPLSPPDFDQPISAAEAPLWLALGVKDFKKGDRVPPGGTYIYTWNTFGWPTTSGVWLYHDHSICDMENVALGAIGIIVIHNKADGDDFEQELPGGDPNGPLIERHCIPIDIKTLFQESVPGLRMLQAATEHRHDGGKSGAEMDDMSGGGHGTIGPGEKERGRGQPPLELDPLEEAGLLELELRGNRAVKLCLPRYIQPPGKAIYLQLYHELTGGGMAINGRKYMGNTPTVLGGTNTRMRFGVVGMNDSTFHTFHLHGHRWVLPGPDGNNPGAIQGSPQVKAVSQFEDTRIFGPANSFGFTINQGSFMGSVFTPNPDMAPGLGEWHMHCHVLGHMMDGMMGSLLVIEGGELALGLPRGVMCPPADSGPPPGPATAEISMKDLLFSPGTVTVKQGDIIKFKNDESGAIPHSVVWSTPTPPGSTPANSPTINQGSSWSVAMTNLGTFPYFCGIHGTSMSGTIVVTP